jgi:hypothetical protein
MAAPGEIRLPPLGRNRWPLTQIAPRVALGHVAARCRPRGDLRDKERRTLASHYLVRLPYSDVAAVLGGTAAARRGVADGLGAVRVAR